MIVLLWALSLFNGFAALASVGLAVRLLTDDERGQWRSKRLLTLAIAIAWVTPLAAIAGTALAWTDFSAGREHGALLALIPVAWLLVMGLVFAIVDFAEDGILGNARSSN